MCCTLLGGALVSEHTNATHTGLVETVDTAWCEEIFTRCGLTLAAAPAIVAPGTDVGSCRVR